MALSVKHLVCKHEDPSLIPRVYIKIKHGGVHFVIPVLGSWRLLDYWDYRKANLALLVSSRVSERPCLEK